MALNLGVGVAVLSTVAVEIVGRSDRDMVLVACGINRSGGDGKIVLIIKVVLIIRVERIDPVLVDAVSTDPLDRASWDALNSRLGVDLNAGLGRQGHVLEWVFFVVTLGIAAVQSSEILKDGTTRSTVVVGKGNQDTTITGQVIASDVGHHASDDSGADSREGLILAEAHVLMDVVLTVEGGHVAVLAVTETDVDLVHEGDWDVGKFGDNGERGGSGSEGVRNGRSHARDGRSLARDGRSLARDGRSLASDGDSSGDDGGDAEQLRDGQ